MYKTILSIACFIATVLVPNLKAQTLDIAKIPSNNHNLIHSNVGVQSGIYAPPAPVLTGSLSTFSDYYDRSDTFMLPSFVQGPINLYLTGTSGSAAEIGVDFDNSASVLIDEVLVLYGAKVDEGGGVKNYKVRLYNRGAQDLPTGSAIATSTISFSNIKAPTHTASSTIPTLLNPSFNFTSIPITPAANVTGAFCATVEIDDAAQGTRDRVYLYTNDCLGDGNTENRICVYPVPNCPKLFGGTVPPKWYDINTFYATVGLSYVFDCDAIIIPIVQGENHSLSANEIKGRANDFVYRGHYPSPTTSSLKINYELSSYNKVVNLRIFDIAGKTVYETNAIDQMAGTYSFDVDVSSFASGNLYYTIKSDNASFSSKFLVIK